MVKDNRNKPRKAPRKRKTAPARMGPVTTINTAPVAIGNSVRGSKPKITQNADGARIVGRDFAFALAGTATAVTGFELIGGMPVTPCVLPSSILRNYCQMFMHFKVNRLTVHYITASPTIQTGDVVFYYESDRNAPNCDYSNNSFLPFVLSNPNTVIGPQWTNHSAAFNCGSDFKSTLYGNQTDINEDAAGSIFLYSKTSTANSPGYILFDYDFSFKTLSVNPRAGTLPVSRGQWFNTCLRQTTATGGTTDWNDWVVAGNTVSNVAATTPNGAALGDIYKIILQVTASQQVNAAWSGTTTTPTASNIFDFRDSVDFAIDDGSTIYGRLASTTGMALYPTLENAITDTRRLQTGAVFTVAVSINLCATISFVYGTMTTTQASY